MSKIEHFPKGDHTSNTLFESCRFGILAVLILLLSLHFHSLWGITLFGDINISLADVATILLAGVWFIRYSLIKRARVNHYFLIALTVVWLFAIWVGFNSLRSPQPIRGLTMWMLLLRDLIILWIIGTSMKGRNIHILNKVVFLLGIWLAIVSVSLYVGALQNYSSIIANPSRHSGAFYELGERGILRLEGFAGDPNFFALFLSLSLLCGFTTKFSKWSIIKWMGFLIIGGALLLSFSRGFLLAFILSTIGMGTIGILWRRQQWKRYVMRTVWPIVLVGIIAFVVVLPSTRQAPAKWFIDRFEILAKRPAWTYWKEVLPMVRKRFILGYGLRMGEETLRGHYVHNSYLGLLLATGIIGLGIYLTFAVLILVKEIFLPSRMIDTLPWIHTWLITLFMFFGFSLLYNPFSWIVAGVFLSQVGRKEPRSV